MYSGINLLMPVSRPTLGKMRLIDGWDILALSAISRWKVPVARNPSTDSNLCGDGVASLNRPRQIRLQNVS